MNAGCARGIELVVEKGPFLVGSNPTFPAKFDRSSRQVVLNFVI